MAREQAQVAFQTGTKKWRYKGKPAGYRHQQKALSKRRREIRAIDRVNKLGLIPTELVDVNAGTGLNTNIEIKSVRKISKQKRLRGYVTSACHHGGGRRLPDSRTEYRY